MKSAFLLLLLFPLAVVNATGTFSMIEINAKHGTEQNVFSDSSKHVYGGGEFSNMTEYNGMMYFVAQDTFGNEELWGTDGTQQGTALVKDINPNGSSMIGNIVIVQGKMVFMATDNGSTFDLWSSDGSSSGTVKIEQTNHPSNDILQPDRAAVFGGKLLFCTNTALISTDGTVGGTTTVLSIAQYAASPAQGYCELNGNAYFMLIDTSGDSELWQTDGTAGGTWPTLNLTDDSLHLAGVQKLFAFNGKLYLIGYASGGNGYDLYSFQPTGYQNHQLCKIQLNANPLLGSNPQYINIVNDRLVFVASTGTGNALFKMSMTDTLPEVVASVSGKNVMSGLSFANDAVYFMSDEWHSIHRVSLNDFSHSTVAIPSYYMPTYALGDGSFLVGGNGKIFFAAYDTLTNQQLFIESNGTPEGTFAISPPGANIFHPFNQILSCGAIDGFDFKMWGDKVIVPANFNDAGRELWIYDAAQTAGMGFVDYRSDISIYPNPVSSQLNFKNNNGYCETSITITDLTGRSLLKSTAFGESGSIDVSMLPAGNYCANVAAGGLTSTKKFIVIK